MQRMKKNTIKVLKCQ